MKTFWSIVGSVILVSLAGRILIGIAVLFLR